MATLSLTWKDFNLNEDGFNIYRSETPMDVNNMPAPIATVGPNVGSYDDTTSVDGTFYYYRVGVVRGNEEVIGDEIIKLVGINLGPGPSTLMAGDMTDGFFGEVDSAELFTGDELATAIGLTAGTSQHSSEPWLKFAIDEKIVFIAKKPYRHSVSWDDIYQAGAVYGTNDNGLYPTGTPTNQNTVVTKGTNSLKVRLMTGAEADPTVDENGVGSEWNRLIYRVHQSVPTDQVGGNWVSYTDADLIITYGTGDGSYNWVQETRASDATRRVARGHSSLSHFNLNTSDYVATYGGWRPALELIV